MSFVTLEPKGLRPPDAAKYIGISEKVLGRCAAAGWIRPSVKARRCVIYRRTACDLLFDRIERDGLPPEVESKTVTGDENSAADQPENL
jgi:hypothetical protein